MITSRKTNLTLTEEMNDTVTMKVEMDMTEVTAVDFIAKVVDMMVLQGYHDLAIWRALKDSAFDLEVYFESINLSKEEWEYKNEDDQER